MTMGGKGRVKKKKQKWRKRKKEVFREVEEPEDTEGNTLFEDERIKKGVAERGKARGGRMKEKRVRDTKRA